MRAPAPPASAGSSAHVLTLSDPPHATNHSLHLQGSFGCSILADWDPTGNSPPSYNLAQNGKDVQMVVANGDLCALTGAPRSITVTFICDKTNLVPQSFTVTEPSTCNYAWDFPTSVVCTGTPIDPNAGGGIIANRNFGCGHISCGWMFIILTVLIVPIAYVAGFLVLTLAMKREGKSRFPLTQTGPLLLDYAWWGVKFFIARFGAWGQATRFKGPSWVNWHLKDGVSSGGSSGFDDGDYPSEDSYQDPHRSSSMYRDDDL